jgi:hypothetical protein
LTSKTGKKFERLYKCRKPVKQYYIYFHDSTLGGPCYLKISSYLPFQCEFYLNGHNAIALQLDQKKIQYKLHGNAIVDIDNPDAIAEAVKSLTGRMVFGRITYRIARDHCPDFQQAEPLRNNIQDLLAALR